jgi:hypothetical protein
VALIWALWTTFAWSMVAAAQVIDDVGDEASGVNPWENWQLILAFFQTRGA